MHLSTRTARAVVAGAAALTVGGLVTLISGGAAQAEKLSTNDTPAFLEPADLPAHLTGWVADPVAAGLPDPEQPCLEGALSADGASHRQYRTELDTHATQLVVETADQAAAQELLAVVQERIENCAADWAEQHPDSTIDWEDFGAVDAGDSAHVYGISIAVPESSYNVHLFGVGAQGNTVTVTNWGQIGTLPEAPVDEFQETTRTAVNGL